MSVGYAEALEERLKEIRSEGGTAAVMYRSCVVAIQEVIRDCMKTVESEGFGTTVEEIRFFKQEATKMHGKLFFYMKLSLIECWRQYCSRERFEELLRETLQEAAAFLEKHKTLCEYYYFGKTYLDEHLFIRRGHGEWTMEEVGTFIGQDFTLGSYWVSWILAYEDLREWVVTEMGVLQGGNAGGIPKKKLKWTGTKVDLVELLYSVHLKGWFNNGKATLKEVMEWGEENLQIRMGNYHVTIDEMSVRKKSRTKCLDELKEGLEEKMDERL